MARDLEPLRQYFRACRDAVTFRDLRDAAKEKYGNKFEDTSDNLYKFFIDRIRDNLHIVLDFSPANPKFAERAHRSPSLICISTHPHPYPPLIPVLRPSVDAHDMHYVCVCVTKEGYIIPR